MIAYRRIELLGGLRIVDGERVITHFCTQKTAALLAFLAYHRDQGHLRDGLIEMLWPWGNPAAGRQSLSTALSALRHQLEPPGIPPGSVLRTDRRTVRMNPETTTTDVVEFECALAAAEKQTDPASRTRWMERGIALYRGKLLAGLFEPWIAPAADRLAERFAHAVLELAEILEARGDAAFAAGLLERAVDAEPRREDLRRRHDRLHVALGEPPATPSAAPRIESPPLPTGTVTLLAIRAADGSEERPDALGAWRLEFRRHGGVEIAAPAVSASRMVAFAHAGDAMSCAAECQLRVAEQTALQSRPRPAPAMAIHTADLAVGPGGTYPAAAMQPAVALLAAARPAQILCSETTAGLVRHGLIGGLRLRELRAPPRQGTDSPGQLAPCADRPDPVPVPRLFELGYPGSLSATAEYERESRPADRLPQRLTRFFGRAEEIKQIASLLGGQARLVTLVGAPGCGKTRLALEAASRVREVFVGRVWFVPLADLAPGSNILDRALDALGIPRSTQATPIEQMASALATQPALIVFDNCEHLLPGAAAELGTFLDHLPHVRCLVTSRRRLDLPAEQQMIVPPLPTPTAPAVDQLIKNECVELFVDRAQWVRPEFQLTAANSTAVARICRLLDGMPLAIEIAAARISVLTPAQIQARLSRGFELLVSRERDVEQRHHSMRAALTWSYELLPVELRRFFAQLSVFRGGWTAGAAEAVCAEPLAVDYLTELVACSLVVAEPETEEVRFRMLELVQQYAADRLAESGNEEPARARHADYFLALAEQAEPELAGPEQGRWLDRLTADLQNLIVAIETCARDQEGPDRALRLAAALYRLWWIRGYWALGRSIIENALHADPGSTPSLARAKALHVAGYLATAQGEMEDARHLLSEALRLFRELGDDRGVAFALLSLSIATPDANLYIAMRRESRDIYRRLGDKHGEGIVIYGLGQRALGQGRDAAAHRLFSQALELVQDDLVYKTGSLGSLGDIAARRGEHGTAETYLNAALAIARRIKFRNKEGALLGTLAALAYETGDSALATERSRQALDIHRGLGAKREIAGDLMAVFKYAAVTGAGDVLRSTLLEWLTHVMAMRSTHYGAHALEAVAQLLLRECPPPMAGNEERMRRCVQFLAHAGRIFTAEACADHPFASERASAALRRALGEDAFATAWEEGLAMPHERAMVYAMEEVSAVCSSAPRPGAGAPPPAEGSPGPAAPASTWSVLRSMPRLPPSGPATS